MLPIDIKNIKGTLDELKFVLDEYQQLIPDIPKNYWEIPLVSSMDGKASNILDDWICKIKMSRIKKRVVPEAVDIWCG